MPWQRGLPLTGPGKMEGSRVAAAAASLQLQNLARHSLRECHVARLSSASRIKSFLRFPHYIFESQTTSTFSFVVCCQTLKTSHLPHLEAIEPIERPKQMAFTVRPGSENRQALERIFDIDFV